MERRYVLLHGDASTGFARLERSHGRGSVTLQAVLPTGVPSARALLLSGDVRTGAVLDLGTLRPDGEARMRLYRERIALPPGGFAAYHTLAISNDWPKPRLLLWGRLSSGPTRWQLEEQCQTYLMVPAEAPPMEAPQPGALARSVSCLPRMHWPRGMEELPAWFMDLPPFAPFHAPGWRFVRIPLEGMGEPTFCAVGIWVREGRLRTVAYALPGMPDSPPEALLPGAVWQWGRHGQGYWVQFQHLPKGYASESEGDAGLLTEI